MNWLAAIRDRFKPKRRAPARVRPSPEAVAAHRRSLGRKKEVDALLSEWRELEQEVTRR